MAPNQHPMTRRRAALALCCLALALVSSRASAAPTAPAPAAAGPSGEAFDPEATNFTYPLPVHFFEFESQRQKLRMAYLEALPEKPNGRTVVLLHGKNFHAGTWAATLSSLQREGFRVVAPDQIGFGKSSKPERYQFSFVQLAANTRALLASLGVERSVVVGHSMGDYAALGKLTRDRIPGAKLTELAGVGHVPQVQAFGAFEKALLEALR
jgi:pimeloyl-ACP methyl ester carboxylesterase